MSPAGSSPLLDIEDLTVAYRTGDGLREAVRHVSLQIDRGQIYGLVGESGSGKTTLALAVMRYLPEAGLVSGGSIRFNGLDLLALRPADLRRIWGAEIALVPQDPLSSLNPSLRIGEQLAEILRHQLHLGSSAAARHALELLESVHLPDPARVAASFPHQLSGGMQQRVLIAMALSTEPKLLVLDEPTTNLDATTQAAMLDLFRELMLEHGTAALYVTHNLGVVAQFCDRVAVLYAGELVEDAPVGGLFERPLHPYTRGLLDSVPRLGESKGEIRLRPIEGRIPSLDDLPAGCIFRPRCPLAIDICEQYPPLIRADPAWQVRCHRWDEIADGRADPRQPPPSFALPLEAVGEGERVLNLEDLQVHFAQRASFTELMTGRGAVTIRAVDGVDLELVRGHTLGLVGESGSGKTTLAQAIMGLVERTEGSIELFDRELPPDLGDRKRETLSHLQLVFQNPQEALNPYLTVGESLSRPLQTLLGMNEEQAGAEVLRLLESVDLSSEYAQRLPGQLSGGEKQRVAIARAFASNPDLLIADEAVSSLDVSVQASILNLLTELQNEHGSAYLFISHDLAVVGYIADVIAVIYLGRLMEMGRAEAIFEPPYHPYTEALLSAIPLIDPAAEQEQIRLDGEVPSAVDVPSGCPFHTRCPRFLGEICVEQEPPWQETAQGTRYFCHIPPDELSRVQKRAFQLARRVEG